MTDTKKHQYAEILHAIADGKEIQTLGITEWESVYIPTVLHCMSLASFNPDRYRVKPDTITVNGIECEAPTKVTTQFKLRVILFHGAAATEEKRFFFNNEEDGYIAYAALIKPFLCSTGERA